MCGGGNVVKERVHGVKWLSRLRTEAWIEKKLQTRQDNIKQNWQDKIISNKGDKKWKYQTQMIKKLILDTWDNIIKHQTQMTIRHTGQRRILSDTNDKIR